MQLITLYDTACGSLNTGDQIILDAVSYHLEQMFPQSQFHSFPTHLEVSSRSMRAAWRNELGFVAGTNLLHSYCRFLGRKNQWSISFLNSYIMQPAILFGVGWNAYAEEPSKMAKQFYRNVLRKDLLHSVRDNYTKDKLQVCGITNVINTGCPTLWQLTEEHIAGISATKLANVIFTLTDYRQSEEADIHLIEALLTNYNEVLFWPQGSGDTEYFRALSASKQGWDKIKTVSPHLNAYNKVLEEESFEYVGTRLHAGIRALQKGRRSTIIGIDNRALEMHKDFNLPVVKREDIERLNQVINQTKPIQLNLPWNKITVWKTQFLH